VVIVRSGSSVQLVNFYVCDSENMVTVAVPVLQFYMLITTLILFSSVLFGSSTFFAHARLVGSSGTLVRSVSSVILSDAVLQFGWFNYGWSGTHAFAYHARTHAATPHMDCCWFSLVLVRASYACSGLIVLG